MKNILLALSLLIITNNYAQTTYCASTENLKDQLIANPNLILHLKDVEQQIQDKMQEGSRLGILTIPVVFHVIHNGDAYGTGENITDEQILSQLDALNRDFNNRNTDTINIPNVFKPLLGNMQIEFCLARFDESGNLFSGIVRHNLGQVAWDRTMLETNGKPNTIFNPNNYFNIWIARLTGDLNGVLGYAQFPGLSPTTDGVVLRYDCVGTTGPRNTGNELGRVATHEVGHWMGLYHIWGDDGGMPDECAGSDSIGDTPNQTIEYYGRPTHPQISCAVQNLFMNYMDYVDDSAKIMFTNGQVNRARASLLSQRGQLLASTSNCNLNLDAEYIGMLSPSDTECNSQLMPILQFRNNGKVNINYLEAIYNIDGGTNKLAKWYGNLAPRQTAYMTISKEIVPIGSHNISIFLFNANNNGNDDYALNDNATKNFYMTGSSTTGAATPIAEGFESSILPAGWSIENPNGDRAWNINTTVGAYGTSGQSIFFDNFDNLSNPTNRKDAFITSTYNLMASNFPYLTFDVAYASRSITRTDTLTLSASTDCGHTWNQLWKQGANDLATQTETNIAFTPTNTQWKTVQVDINTYINTDQIQFKFENKSGWGNMLYIDNINIKSYGVSVPEITKQEDELVVYPNPSTNEIQIFTTAFSNYPMQYSILNGLGQELKSGWVYGKEDKIDISSLETGCYYIQLNDQHKNRITKKITTIH